MITKIVLDNIYEKGKRIEAEFNNKNSIIESRTVNYETWNEFYVKVEALRTIRKYFERTINIDIDQFNFDPSTEYVLEIEMEWEGKHYRYSNTFYNSELVMESLLGDGNWIFSRFKDAPDFALDLNYLEKNKIKLYDAYKEFFNLHAISCFTPGIELLKEIDRMIVVDDWIHFNKSGYINKLKQKFPDLNYKKIIDGVISTFGFSSDYKEISEDGLYLITNYGENTKMPIECSGSGFLWLSILVPLMIASKKYGLPLVSNVPLDNSLHPILGRALMKWYLKNNPNYPLCRLQHVELNYDRF